MKILATAILLTAYLLLYWGLTEPLLTLSAEIEKADLANFGKDLIIEDPNTPEFVGNMAKALVDGMELEGSIDAYDKTRSIIGTIRVLIDSQHLLVAFLIGLFSIVIPILKGVFSIIAGFASQAIRQPLLNINAIIGKWAMADVFVVAIFVAFLAANAIDKEGGLLSFNAILGDGFYFFLSYCLLANVGSQLLLSASKDKPHPAVG